MHRLSAFALAVTLCASSLAAERTWDGNAAADTWSASDGPGGNTNWTHKPPPGQPILVNGDRLVFTGNARLSNRNDYDSLWVSGLSFATGAGGFTLGGRALELRGDLRNESARLQILQFDALRVGADQTWAGGSGGLLVSGFELGDHALTLDGAVTAKTNALLKIGRSGRAQLSAGAGGVLQTGGVWLGENAGSFGQVALAQGASWSADDLFYVGLRGEGNLSVTQGAQLRTAGGHVGRFAGSVGYALVSGADSRWENSGARLRVGYEGLGTVLVTQQGLLRSDSISLGELAGGDGLITLVQGGRLEAHQLLLGGSSGGRGLLHLSQAGVLKVDSLVARGGGSHVSASGANSLLEANNLTLMDGAWMEVISAQARVSSEELMLGTVALPGRAHVRVSSGELRATRAFIGTGGPAELQVQGGRFVGQTLNLGAQGRVSLEGGELAVNTLHIAEGARFAWTGGQLSSTSLALDSLPGRFLRVPDQGTLYLSRTLSLGAGTLLALGEDASLSARTVLLDGGSLLAPRLNLDGIGALRGPGTVLARIQGGAGQGIEVSNGVLVLGDAAASDGFDFQGTLLLGPGAQAVVLDRDAAQLGARTVLEVGAQLGAVNGWWLGEGDTLVATGDAEVRGAFVNHGSVEGPSVGSLRFSDLVSGSGSFSGRVLFADGYAPDGAVNFGGGAVQIEADSKLVLDLGDRLHGIGHLQLDGTVLLRLAPDTAAGRYELLDFASLSGAFTVQVQGLDAPRVDWSRLALDGSIAISAVPEPTSGALLAVGALFVAWRRRAMV